ncbi:MAG: glutamyl-tRNA reductase [Verrucomicrobiota bacterium]|jgi:glutamyl-tRNA reductase|nr:glutamyl-tRNA reductase [Verrucomicrobiota bacterium]MDP7048001.1 glutamyl-tRNA reductase [Verrucomicrobiota bacterium]
MPIVVTGLSHHSSPVELRERFAFSNAQIAEAFYQLRKRGIVDEAVILSTCNRVEIYAASRDSNPALGQALSRFICEFHGISEAPEDALYTHHDPQSVDHLFHVACGIDSMVLGETEILGQLKLAYKLAHAEKATGPLLNKTFQKAFNVGKLVRSETQIQRGSISVSSVAVELAESIFDSLKAQQVLIIGAGDTSEKAARALRSRGTQNILVSNRSHDRAVALAAELDGRAVGYDTWEEEFQHVDIIISSTAAPHYILTRDKLDGLLRKRGHRPLLLVDIAVPRDIHPNCNQLENVYVYNIDDLQGIAGQYLEQRKAELELCQQLINAKRNELLDNLNSHPDKTNLGLHEQPADG